MTSDRLDQLRATLSELDSQLRQLDAIDEPTRALLAEAAAKIIDVISRGERSPEGAPTDASLRDRLVEFEASHPQLAGILSRLLDGLGQLGI
jgi:hypothetical protein